MNFEEEPPSFDEILGENVIDSRDITDRRDWIVDRLEEITDGSEQRWEGEKAELQEEAGFLNTSLKEIESVNPSSRGIVLVKKSFFPDFVKQEAFNLHGVDINNWPFSCIDWDEAERRLRDDYAEIFIDGTSYLCDMY